MIIADPITMPAIAPTIKLKVFVSCKELKGPLNIEVHQMHDIYFIKHSAWSRGKPHLNYLDAYLLINYCLAQELN